MRHSLMACTSTTVSIRMLKRFLTLSAAVVSASLVTPLSNCSFTYKQLSLVTAIWTLTNFGILRDRNFVSYQSSSGKN